MHTPRPRPTWIDVSLLITVTPPGSSGLLARGTVNNEALGTCDSWKCGLLALLGNSLCLCPTLIHSAVILALDHFFGRTVL